MIELRSLKVEAGPFELSNIDLLVPSGTHAALMGRTGQGKTTLLEAICGLRRVASGRILIDDTDVTDWPPGDRQIGYVPQDLALFPTFTVREHLEFALTIRKTPRSRVRERCTELSEMLGIETLMARSLEGLSGGERQRVALGRALSFAPRVLLLDEPLSALDDKTRDEMRTLLDSLKSSTGVTTLQVTHNRTDAEFLGDAIYELSDSGLARTR